MKRIVLCFILAAFSFGAYCQIEQKMKDEGVVNGSIIKNGKEIEGYLKRNFHVSDGDQSFPAPWKFQKEVNFIQKEVFEKSEKIKNKMFEKYEASDLDGYIYQGQLYESVKYADMSAVGLNMIPKKMFLKKVLDNKISLYNFYAEPPIMVSGKETFAQYYTECGKPTIVYKIGKDGKLKSVFYLNVEKEMSDCQTVTNKFKNDEYKTEANKVFNNDEYRMDIRMQAINEYNEICK